MKLTLHVVRKDVRHLWLPLAVWAVLLLLDLFVVGSLLGQPTSVRAHRIARVAAFLLRPLQTLLLVISVPLIVHEDPAVGTTAFWLTRPIPRTTMLAAKAVSVGALFVIAPTLVEVAILRLHGIVPRDIGLAIPEVLVTWTWWAATVAALAALTPNFARFALVGAVVTVTVMLLWLAEMVASLYLDLGRPRGTDADVLALASSRSLVQWLFYIAVGGAVVAHQYVTRRTRRSVMIAMAGALLAFGVGTAWPWNFLPGGRAVRSPSSPSGMTIEVAPSHVAEQTPVPGYASDSLQVLGHLQLGGIPEGRAVDALVMRSHLTYPGEAPVTFDRSGPDAGQAWLSPRWDPGLVRRVLGGVSLVNPEHAPDSPLVLSVITRSAYQRHRGVEGTYKATVNVSLLAYEVTGVRPLTREAHPDRLSRVAILSVEREGDAIVVVARETVLQLLFRGEPRWFGASMLAELGRRTLYVLRNPDQGEALWPTHHPFTDVDPLILLEIVSGRPLKQHVRRLVYKPPVPIGQEWLRQAELVRIEAHEVGSTFREVVIVPFVLPPSPR